MTTGTDHPSPLPQGDVRLLEEPAARELLGRAIPLRMAYVDRRGAPGLVPTWFHWNGDEVVMTTWVSGPHIVRPVQRLHDLAERPEVLLSIDTEGEPPTVLKIRGTAVIEQEPGVLEEHRISAEHYLGPDVAPGYLAQFADADVVMARIRVRPRWVSLIDFAERLPAPLGGVR